MRHKFLNKSLGTGLLISLAFALSIGGAIWLWQASNAAKIPRLAAPATEVPAAGAEPKPPGAGVEESASSRTAGAGTTDDLPITPKEWQAGAFSPSLEGTDIDGHLRADADGNLVLELEVKDFFDYFLNTVGEVSPEEAIAQIQGMANKNLPPGAARQAEALLENYLAFKQRAFDYAQQPLAPPEKQTAEYQLQQLRKAQAAIQRIRRETLPPEAVEAFFGLEEAYGDFTLASIQIQRRDDLNARQKQEMINYERSRLPPPLKNSHQRVRRSSHQAGEVEAVIRNAPTPQAARTQLQDMGLTDEHVEEIVTVLESQSDFEQQYVDYRRERQQLEEAGLSAVDRDTAEKALRERYFDSEQQKTWARLRDLDAPSSASRDEG